LTPPTATPSSPAWKGLLVPVLGPLTRLSIRLSRLPRVEGFRLLICVPNDAPYQEAIARALQLVGASDPESLGRAKRCWFAISIRELPAPESARWNPRLRVLELSSVAVRDWHPLLLAGTLAKFSILHWLTLNAKKLKPLTLNERLQAAEDHATWFFSLFPLTMREDAQRSLEAARGITTPIGPQGVATA
jgi:hypothetical protein